MKPMRFAVLAAAAAALATGCGESCPTGSADVEQIPQSCSLAANQSVTMYVQVCPHCNETSPRCEVDTDNAASTGEIFLNTFWELCEENQDCPGDQGCQNDGVACSFTVPPGTYTVISANGPTATVTVPASGGSSSCGSTGAALTYSE